MHELHRDAVALIGRAVGTVLDAAVAAVTAGRDRAEVERIATELDQIDLRLNMVMSMFGAGGSALMVGAVSDGALRWECKALVGMGELLDMFDAELPAEEEEEAV